MQKIPLVSVIIPMYNSEKFIPQTLESLLYQTMPDFEVVVVDDCSTDNSVAVVESFAKKFSVGGGIVNFTSLNSPKIAERPEFLAMSESNSLAGNISPSSTATTFLLKRHSRS